MFRRLDVCSDIKVVRTENPLDKWYASGKLGATPMIDDADILIEMQENGFFSVSYFDNYEIKNDLVVHI